jgi:hypothetical protein
MHARYSTAGAKAKAKPLCSFSPSFSSERRLLLASRKTRRSGKGLDASGLAADLSRL